MRAPTGTMPKRSFKFEVVDKGLEPSPFAELPPLSSTEGHLVPVPGNSLIKPVDVPSSLVDYAKKRSSITSWLVTVFADSTVVGLSVPHGVFDATGLALVTKALDAELHGRAWVVPPLDEENQLEKRLAEVEQLDFSQAEKDKTPPPMVGWTGAWPPHRVARLLADGAYERAWHEAEDGCLFVGKELLAPLLEEVKAQVASETGGRDYVSEGDVLVNWLYKVRSTFPSEPLSRIS